MKEYTKMSDKSENKPRNYEIIVIGAGPAGMTAAITAARAGRSVLIIDKNKKLGRKLYATGNGRCNLSNNHLDLECYNSEDEYFPYQVINNAAYMQVNDFVTGLGVPVHASDTGWYYPVSGQASTVVWAFADAIKSEGIALALEESCTDIAYDGQSYTIKTDKNTYITQKLILACGGSSAPKLGGSESGISLCRQLGLKTKHIAPALCRLYVSDDISSLNGVRNRAKASLYDENLFYQKQTGELQFAGDALSGIMIYNLSSMAQEMLYKGRRPILYIDLVPDMKKDALKDYLFEYAIAHGKRTVNACLNGLINDRLAEFIVKKNNINKMKMEDLSENTRMINKLAYNMKSMIFHVTGTGDMNDCQVMKGGIDVRQINPINMMVKGSHGLYIVGELLDVDGICGGYNIMWAIATGIKAGMSAGND